MPEKFGLPSDVIRKIQSIFLKNKHVEKVIIFGSRAMGNYRAGSDIDLTLIGLELTLSEQLNIENELDDLLLPYKIDLSLFQQIENSDLKTHIQKRGLIFYEK
jgi:predicted nucleotidyltransferase